MPPAACIAVGMGALFAPLFTAGVTAYVMLNCFGIKPMYDILRERRPPSEP